MSVDADIPASQDLFGKTVNDLQSDVEVSSDAITGTLKFVSDYVGFSSDVSLQSGNYLALHCDVSALSDETVTVEVVNGHYGPVVLDDDKLVVLRIENKDTQKVKVTASRNGDATVTKTYSLTGLTLNES